MNPAAGDRDHVEDGDRDHVEDEEFGNDYPEENSWWLYTRHMDMLAKHLPRWYTEEMVAEANDRRQLLTAYNVWIDNNTRQGIEELAVVLLRRFEVYDITKDFFHRFFAYVEHRVEDRSAMYDWYNYVPRIDHDGILDRTTRARLTTRSRDEPPHRTFDRRTVHDMLRDGTAQKHQHLLSEEQQRRYSERTGPVHRISMRVSSRVAHFVAANLLAHSVEVCDNESACAKDIMLYLRVIIRYVASASYNRNYYTPPPITISPFLCMRVWPSIPNRVFSLFLKKLLDNWWIAARTNDCHNLFAAELGIILFRWIRRRLATENDLAGDFDLLFQIAVNRHALPVAVPLSMLVEENTVVHTVVSYHQRHDQNTHTRQWLNMLLRNDNVTRFVFGVYEVTGNAEYLRNMLYKDVSCVDAPNNTPSGLCVPGRLVDIAAASIFQKSGLLPLLRLHKIYSLPLTLRKQCIRICDLYELRYCDLIGYSIGSLRERLRKPCGECDNIL